MLPSIGVAPAVAGAAVSPTVAGTTEAWAVTISDFAGICNFWPTFNAVVLLRLFARARSPILTPSAFAIFQSESPFLMAYVLAVGEVAGAAAATAGAEGGCAGVRLSAG